MLPAFAYATAMARRFQQAEALERRFNSVVNRKAKEVLSTAASSDPRLAKIGASLCEALLKYCSYAGDEAKNNVDPFDDPFVGAALLRSDGELIGAHRKESRNEAHAEVEALLEALEGIDSEEAEALHVEIREKLRQKSWLRSAADEKAFVGLFADAGGIVRDHYPKDQRLILLSTLEPCRDFESQPSCSTLISAFKPDIVFYACDDTNAKGQGRGVLLSSGLAVIPNVAPEMNVKINRLFYAAVHYLGRLQSSALEPGNRFEITYVVASLSRLNPICRRDEKTGRVQIIFDNPDELPVHRAPTAPRAPKTNTELHYDKNAIDEDRVLFISSLSPDFLALYLQRHLGATQTLPGIIISPQGHMRAEGAGDQASFTERLSSAGFRVYTNVLRKSDEQFLAVQSILRFKESTSPEGELYVFSKREGDQYSNFSGRATDVVRSLLRMEKLQRVSVYVGQRDVRALHAFVTQLENAGAFQANSEFALASFHLFLVAEDDATGLKREISRFLNRKRLSSRFAVSVVKDPSMEHSGQAALRQLVNSQMDPLAEDPTLLHDLLTGTAWTDRQTAGFFLAGAARQDPFLYSRLIASRLPRQPEPDDWREVTSILNAVAKYGRPYDPADAELILNRMREFSIGLNELAGGGQPAPQLIDLVWRYIAAGHALAETSYEVADFFGHRNLTAFIGRSPFLLKEFFFYASRAGQAQTSAIEHAFDILGEYGPKLPPEDLASVMVRITRLSATWQDMGLQSGLETLFAFLQQHPDLARECDDETMRCKIVAEGGLSAVFQSPKDAPRLFATYLFLRTASGREGEPGLYTAVMDEMRRRLSPRQSQRLTLPWRGDRTTLARLALSEVPSTDVISYLRTLAEDEDDSVKWAAIMLAMDFSVRARLLGPSPGKRKCVELRKLVSSVIQNAMAGKPHYWLSRELLTLFALEHSDENPLPQSSRLTLMDLPRVRTMLRAGDSDGLHPEVLNELNRVRRQTRRIALILPPLQVGSRSPREGQNTSTPPLGLASIGTLLLSEGHDVDLIDCHRFPELIAELPKLLDGVDVAGFNVVTSSFRATEHLVAQIRRRLRQRAPIIVLGGPAVSLHPQEFISHDTFHWDYLVLGDGEDPMLSIVQATITGRPAVGPGILDHQSNIVQRSRATIRAESWDAHPWIDHRIFRTPSGEEYEPLPTRNMRHRETHLVMTRGCAWKCTFCTEAILRGADGEARRSAADVIEEIRYLVDVSNVTRVQFVDDNLLPQIAARDQNKESGRAWAEDFLDGLQQIASTNPNFGWRGIFRFEDFLAYERLVPGWYDQLTSSNCVLLAFGVEHGNFDRREKLKGGTISNEEISRVVNRLRQIGIATKGYFIVGGPEEDDESTDESIRMAISSGFTLSYFALYKNFRGLVALSRSGRLPPPDREAYYMSFRSLTPDLEERISGCDSAEDGMRAFGREYAPARLAEARQTMVELRELGFRFDDLFKYNDFHDNLDITNAELGIWKGTVPAPDGFLRAVRRAYFEFYARREFVEDYRRLLTTGY